MIEISGKALYSLLSLLLNSFPSGFLRVAPLGLCVLALSSY
jgi:hypothetical protein